MAALVKRTAEDGGVSWQAQIRLKGFPTQTATFARKTDAAEWAQRTEADMKAGRYFGGAKLHTFSELKDKYLAAAADLKSIRDRRLHLSVWLAEFGDCLLSEITSERIREAKSNLTTPERGAVSMNRYLASLSACFTYAVKDLEWVERNPCQKVRKAKENSGRVRFLDDDELKRLLTVSRSAEHPDLHLAIVLSLTTGARQGEIFNLRWPQIDFTRRVITLNQGTTKNNDARSIPLVGEAFTLLQERAKVRRIDNDQVFPPLIPLKFRQPKKRNLYHSWNKLRQSAGLVDFHWHDMRHTAASYLVMNGVSLTEVAKILGHRTLAMVARYAHLADQHIVDAGDKLAQRMGL